MLKKDGKDIIRDFGLRRGRQITAIFVTITLILILAAIFRRPDIFGEFSKNTLVIVQLLLIAVFIAFSASNWKCPSCNKILGSDINRSICNRCGAKLK